MTSFLSVDRLSKSYGNNIILDDISLKVEKGEFFFLLGPSGCGKTTLLRSIAGLVENDSGAIVLNGNEIHKLPAYKRDVNTVFQNYALFPHMSVADNVGFGLRMKNRKKSEIDRNVSEMLKLVDLYEFRNRLPSQLSGGQMQRVALARALANKPSLLLLDEPLGALDVKLRKQMQNELIRIQKEVGITFICVTHDQEEALSVGDRIAVMNDGKLEQIGKSEELYNYPSTKFVCDFLGESNFIRVENSQFIENEYVLKAFDAPIKLKSNRNNIVNPKYAAIRPEHISITNPDNNQTPEYNSVLAYITNIRFSGPFFEVLTKTDNGLSIVCRVPSKNNAIHVETGKQVILSWKPENVILLNG